MGIIMHEGVAYGGIGAISEASDVAFSSPADGQIIEYDGTSSKWVNTTLGTAARKDVGVASGVAELDANGKVPSSQLPSFVDDVVEGYYDSQTDRFYEESTFVNVITPVDGKSWVDIATNKSYRWTGTVYVRVDEGVQLGETSDTAYRGDRGKTAYDHSQSDHSGIAPAFSEASTRANIASGETFATILGKIKKWFSDLKVVEANPSGTATNNLTKLGIDGTNYNVTDADYQSTMHTFTTTGYNASTHKFEGSEISMSYAVKSIFSPLATVYDAIKTAINDHASVFTTINTAISNLTTALSYKVDKDSVTFKDLTSSGHRFGTDLSIVSQFTGSNDVLHENTNLTAIKTVVNNLADYTEENVEIESLPDTTPYLYRKSPAIGTRVMENALVGASVVKNQLVQNGNFVDTSNWTSVNGATINSASNNILNVSIPATQYSGIRQTITMTKGHIYLVSASVKCSEVMRIDIDSVNPTNISGNGNWDTKQILFDWRDTGNYNFNIRKYVAGNSATMECQNVKIVDITQWFGSNSIPNNAYTKEQSTAGSGIAWLKSQGHDFSKYIPHNTGTLESVNPSAKKVVGFNQWDEEWESGAIDGTNGSKVPASDRIRSVNMIPVLPSKIYWLCAPSALRVRAYNADKSYYGVLSNSYNVELTIPNDVHYIMFDIANTTYNHDICINISKPTGTPKNGDYVPYEKHTYPISEYPLRGLFVLENDEIKASGDRRKSDGKVDIVFDECDLGDLEWTYYTSGTYNIFYASVSGAKAYATNDTIKLLNLYPIGVSIATSRSNLTDVLPNKSCGWISGGTNFVIRDDSYNDATAFKTAMDGVKLQFEKSTPTQGSAIAFDNPQISIVGGTEEWLTDNDVPVGHESVYKELPPMFEDEYIEYLQEQAESVNIGKNILPMTLAGIKAANPYITWTDETSFTIGNVTVTFQMAGGDIYGIHIVSTGSSGEFFNLCFEGVDYSRFDGCILSGCDVNDENKIYIAIRKYGGADYFAKNISGDTVINYTADQKASIFVYLRSGSVDTVLKPMIRKPNMDNTYDSPKPSNEILMDLIAYLFKQI